LLGTTGLPAGALDALRSVELHADSAKVATSASMSEPRMRMYDSSKLVCFISSALK